MNIDTRSGTIYSPCGRGLLRLARHGARHLSGSLRRVDPGIDRALVRVPCDGGDEVVCRIRLWSRGGGALVIEERARAGRDAIHAAARVMKRSLGRRSTRARDRRRALELRRRRERGALA